MINFNFNIAWPCSDIKTNNNYFIKDWKITKNKNLEIQICKSNMTLFGFGLDFSPIGQSHGGLVIDFTLFKYMIILGICDRRHWNYKESRWYKYDEETYS